MKLITTITIAMTLLGGLTIVAAAKKPNVIVILGDDMGIDSVGAFNPIMGLKTPAIDRLAKSGMSFMDAHSTSGVCSPTRYSVLTGRYNWRSRLKARHRRQVATAAHRRRTPHDAGDVPRKRLRHVHDWQVASWLALAKEERRCHG